MLKWTIPLNAVFAARLYVVLHSLVTETNVKQQSATTRLRLLYKDMRGKKRQRNS